MQSRLGRFERADGGTLFLDEIGTLSASAQGKLLRALQEGEIERLGDTQTRRVDVRVIAATNVDLREEVRAGRFREDLFFRLNVFPIRIPPLRERREDIPLLMNAFPCEVQSTPRPHAGPDSRSAPSTPCCPTTGRATSARLENVIERGVILAPRAAPSTPPHLFTSGEQLGDRRFALSREGRLVAERPASQLHRRSAHADDDVDRVIAARQQPAARARATTQTRFRSTTSRRCC